MKLTLRGRRRSILPPGVILIALALAALSCDALACRCAPRALADYYADADHVFIARAATVAPVSGAPEKRLTLHTEERVFKGKPGGVREFRTGDSSASCGMDVPDNARLVVFAKDDPSRPGLSWVNTCNGTRRIDVDGGFEDVPAPQVEDALEQLARLASPDRFDRAGVPQAHSIIGLATVPRLMETGTTGHEPVPVFAAPQGSCGRRMILGAHELVSREAEYESPAAVVHEVRDGRFRLALADNKTGGSGWLPREYVGRYWPLTELLPDRMTYLTDAWDGRVWPRPRAGEPRRAPRGDDEPVVEVVGSSVRGGSTWLQIRLFAGNPCEGDEPEQIDLGWVPAWNGDGLLTVWFWSRGC